MLHFRHKLAASKKGAEFKMKLLCIIFLGLFFISCISQKDTRKTDEQRGYSLSYTILDKQNIKEYHPYFTRGKRIVEEFFQSPFKSDFCINIHPSRASLDSTWQSDWGMPDFTSQCWMVASGVATKLDIISPKKWDSLACEHSYSNHIKTQRLITHELVHVFHGQQNVSPDFSDVTGIDWFVEGLATYASGQCDSIRISEVKNAILRNEIPDNLNKFWSGKLRYGLSGTVVMYLDTRYGRKKLSSLLRYHNVKNLLNSLETTESEIMSEWKDYINEL